MPVIESALHSGSPDWSKNREGHLKLIEEFRALEQKVRDNSARSLPKFRARGQLLPRERIDMLLDRGSPWLELSTLCGLGMHDDDGGDGAAGGGTITGIGVVSGVRCMITASDSGIRGGAMTPMGVHKSLRVQDIAMQNNLPFLQLVESAGANLFRQADLFVLGGRSFANMAKMSAMGLPIVTVVNGSSTAGGAYQTGLSDYVIAVRGRTRVFLAGPPLLKSATGEIASEEELGGAEMHYHQSGTAEYLAEDDADGNRLARLVMAHLNWTRAAEDPRDYAAPLYDAEDLLGAVPVDHRQPYDCREVIARLVDGSEYLDFKPAYGERTVTGHAQICGFPVGIIGNNGPIDADGAAKAAQFIQLCCQSQTPLVFLQNTTGYMVGVESETSGIVKHGSKMVQAVTNATVPKFTVHIGASFGAGNYGMCGRSFDPRFIFAWPNNRISVMGGEQAAGTMRVIAEAAAERRGREPDREALDAQDARIIETYEREGRALFATARLWDDGLIDPRDTRRVLGLCLSIARDGDARTPAPNTFGVGRM
ncbi:MAG: acyl-CoA carboxylase subunit beta [Gammaproteobacteria bacterium AqS3]|nr:acyl-CoA carboxylase subunit beta [Gammaproteobacteria bacterium AqS3]